MADKFRELLNKVKCGKISAVSFSQDDLDRVKACLPELDSPVPTEEFEEPTFEDSCLPAALEEVQRIIEESQKNVNKLAEVARVRSRVEEYLDNLRIINEYYTERLRFFNEVSKEVDQLTAERLATNSRILANLSTGNTANNVALYARVNELETLVQTTLSNKISGYTNIPDTVDGRADFQKAVGDQITKITKKVVTDFSNRHMVFDLRLFELTTATLVEGTEQRTIPIRTSPYLTNDNVLSNIEAFVRVSNESKERDESNAVGKLYTGGDNYLGLYRKLANPVPSFFTLDQRGLTTKLDEIDPELLKNPDSPKTVKENDTTYFIRNFKTYSEFLSKLGELLPDKIKNERELVYPAAIQPNVILIKAAARREAASEIMTSELENNLSRDTVFDGSVYSANSNSSASVTLRRFTKAADSVAAKILALEVELTKLDETIKDFAADPADIEAKIKAIPCFKGAAEKTDDCEKKTKEKLGTDPFGVNTLEGTDGALPDFTSLCYWKHFAEALNTMSLLPFPDIQTAGAQPMFRYYPINSFIPTPVGLLLLPLPQRWKVLSVIASPLGVVVPMLSTPITFPSPIPIPLPSVFVLYVAPDGKKYMLAAPNIPFLIQPNQMKIGYEIDQSTAAQNPLGLSGPYKGLPIKGAFSLPLSAVAGTSKAARLAKIAYDLSMGKIPEVTMPNGKVFRGDVGELDVKTLIDKMLTEYEFALKSVETSPVEAFDGLVFDIRTTIKNQLDSWGDFSTNALDSLKRKIVDAQQKEYQDAYSDEDNERKRKRKEAARKLDTVTIQQKVTGLLDELNELIDKIDLGTITYPDDPSKLNPKLPPSITSIIDLLKVDPKTGIQGSGDNDLMKKIKRISKKIDPKTYTDKLEFDLDSDEAIEDIKRLFKRMSDACIGYFKGDDVPVNTSEATSEGMKQEIAENEREIQDLLVKALSFTAVSFAAPPKITMFDPTKPCCETEAKSLFQGVPPEVLAVLSVATALISAIIDGLDKDTIKSFFGGLVKVSVDSVNSAFSAILALVPSIAIPEGFNAKTLVRSILTPFLTQIALPDIYDPTRPPMIHIKIPLNAIVKPLLKAAVSAILVALFNLLADLFAKLKEKGKNTSSEMDLSQIVAQIDCGGFGIVTLQGISVNQLEVVLPDGKKIKLPKFPDLPLDIFGFFWFMMNTDVISLIKSLLLAALESVLGPIEDIVRPILNLVPSGSWSSLSAIEGANPFALAIKIIKLTIDNLIPKGLKVNLTDLDVYPILMAAAVATLGALDDSVNKQSPVFFSLIATGIGALCMTGSEGVRLARISHPVFNQDDLPPWERLTPHNPLFAVFLDEFIYKSTIMSLGTLIFYSKSPGMYGTTVVPSIFVPPVRL